MKLEDFEQIEILEAKGYKVSEHDSGWIISKLTNRWKCEFGELADENKWKRIFMNANEIINAQCALSSPLYGLI